MSLSSVSSLAMQCRLNGVWPAVAERLEMSHPEPPAAVAIEQRLWDRVVVDVRWQTKYLRRNPRLERHWQRQVAKSPRPAFPA